MELTGNVQGLIDLVGGGSDVEFEQILESGEKIGVITIDSVPTDIYAPTPEEPTSVEVTQVVSSGTKIASIKVDGEGVDLYAPTPEAPTSVEVTQVVSSGTKIASIEVDGVSTDLYAPKGGIDYSTNEQIIGTWLDGKNAYQKLFPLSDTTIFDTTSKNVTSLANFSVIKQPIMCFGIYDVNPEEQCMPLLFYKTNNNFYIQASVRCAVTKLLIIYTKTTD